MSIYKLFKFILYPSLLIIFFLNIFTFSFAEIIILSSCDSKKDTFLKNEYILDLEKSLMTRNFIYDHKTYKKHKITDIKTKKENSITRFIYKENNFILSEKIGYPQFFTQLFFEKDSLVVKLKTVINKEAGISILSKCKKIDNFDKKT
jgi:hypothetical protein